MNRAFTTIEVLIALALLGLAFPALKPKFLDGDSKRATASQEATAAVSQATAEAEAAAIKRSATAAASVAQIGVAASTLEDSPEKQFITREVPVAQANLPAPDALAMQAAYERRLAIMEGKLSESNRLYGDAFTRADELASDLIVANSARAKAQAERTAIDRELAEVAAARLAASKTMWRVIIIGGLIAGLYIYTKLTHLSPDALSNVVRDIRGSESPLSALDNATTPLQQRMIRRLTKLKTEPTN